MNLSTKDKLLYKRIDEVIHYLWDPIGVSDVPEARDEYDSYLSQIFKLVQSESINSVSKYLSKLESDRLGETTKKEHCDKIAEILVNWKEYIEENTA